MKSIYGFIIGTLSLAGLLIFMATMLRCNISPETERTKKGYMCFKLKTRCVCEKKSGTLGTAFETDCGELEGFKFYK